MVSVRVQFVITSPPSHSMVFDTRIIINCLVVALASTPVLALATAPVVALKAEVPDDHHCYGGGSTKPCLRFINQFCKEIAKTLVGSADTVQHCFNYVDDANNIIECNMGAFNTDSLQENTIPKEAYCKDALQYVGRTCESGGWARVNQSTEIAYSMDPNSGKCPPFEGL